MGFGGGAFLVRVVILAGVLFPGKARMAAVTWLYVVLSTFEVPYPIVMGWITDTFHWNYAFLIDFPFLAIGAFLIWKIIPPGFLFERKKESHVDSLVFSFVLDPVETSAQTVLRLFGVGPLHFIGFVEGV